MGFEYNIIKFFQANATTGWITFFQIVTLFGSYLGFLLAFIIVFAKSKKLSIFLIIAFAVASAINFVLKEIIARDRPFVTYSDIINYGNESGYSMPSGHSLCAGIFATYVVYVLFCSRKEWWTRLLGTFTIALFPACVMLSRMVLGVHYFTDTLLGLSLGILFAVLSIVVYTYLSKMKNGRTNNRN